MNFRLISAVPGSALRRRLLVFLACIPGLLAGAPVVAAEEAPAALKRYEVEVIVFRHTDQSRNTPEIPAASAIFRPSPLDLILAEPPLQAAEMPTTLDETPGLVASPGQRKPPIGFLIMELKPAYPDFVPLRTDVQTLNRVYQRLEQVDAYQPLLHTGWVQPAYGSNGAKPYRFEPAVIGEIGIAGTVTLYKERFLHLEIDLALETEESTTATRYLFSIDKNNTPDEYTLTESRRIRGTTTQYFDHPQFGVIARVQEVTAAAAVREETS